MRATRAAGGSNGQQVQTATRLDCGLDAGLEFLEVRDLAGCVDAGPYRVRVPGQAAGKGEECGIGDLIGSHGVDFLIFGSFRGDQRFYVKRGMVWVRMLLSGKSLDRLGEAHRCGGIKSPVMSDVEQGREEGVEGERSSARGAAEFAFGSGLQPEARAGFSPVVWGVAALIVFVVAGTLIFAGRKKPAEAPRTLQPVDAYAASLPLSQFAMSESENLTGGKLTYLDGHVQNAGSKTVTAVTVQVVFANDEALAPEIDTLPLTLIGMTQPYIDVQPVSANPLKPGDDREFRLTFDKVPDNWNTEMPVVRVIGISSR
jgi:hypothetical protein